MRGPQVRVKYICKHSQSSYSSASKLQTTYIEQWVMHSYYVHWAVSCALLLHIEQWVVRSYYVHWAVSRALLEFPSEVAASDAIDALGLGSSSCQLQTLCQQQHRLHHDNINNTSQFTANWNSWVFMQTWQPMWLWVACTSSLVHMSTQHLYAQ